MLQHTQIRISIPYNEQKHHYSAQGKIVLVQSDVLSHHRGDCGHDTVTVTLVKRLVLHIVDYIEAKLRHKTLRMNVA